MTKNRFEPGTLRQLLNRKEHVRYLGGDPLIGYQQSQIQIFYSKHYFNFCYQRRKLQTVGGPTSWRAAKGRILRFGLSGGRSRVVGRTLR